MNTYLVPLVIIGGLTSRGVYLLLSRNLTRMLLGLLLVGNAVNLLIMTVGGPSGNPPVRGRTSGSETTTADPLAQGMILTAIVITMGIAAFVLALIYRSFRLAGEEEVPDDAEDTRVSRLPDDAASSVVEDRPADDRVGDGGVGDSGVSPGSGDPAGGNPDGPDELDALPETRKPKR